MMASTRCRRPSSCGRTTTTPWLTLACCIAARPTWSRPHRSETPLPLQESEEARRSKLLLRPVFRLEHSVGVENAAISGPEGKFQRTVRGVFRKAEQQAVRIDFSKHDLFSIQCSHDEWRMTRP